ncbi:hypothetical protein L3Q82_015542, partial [Scortum barcoo]
MCPPVMLSRRGKVVSPIKKVLSGCKSPLLRHVVSLVVRRDMSLRHVRNGGSWLRSGAMWSPNPGLVMQISPVLGRLRLQTALQACSLTAGRDRQVKVTVLSDYEENEELFEEICSGLPQVSADTNSQLDCPLSTQELHAALQSMQGRKAPGIDGLTVEFYKASWDILAGDLLEVFNESLASGSLPLSCRRAVITLLPKKGNLQDIKNWRSCVSPVHGLQNLVQSVSQQAEEGDGADHPSGPDVLRAWQIIMVPVAAGSGSLKEEIKDDNDDDDDAASARS